MTRRKETGGSSVSVSVTCSIYASCARVELSVANVRHTHSHELIVDPRVELSSLLQGGQIAKGLVRVFPASRSSRRDRRAVAKHQKAFDVVDRSAP